MGALMDKIYAERKKLMFQIRTAHLAVGIDAGWTGVNVYSITDLALLVEWWNKTIRYGGDAITREIADKELAAFNTALWLRINMIHPKQLLSFADITKPELVRQCKMN